MALLLHAKRHVLQRRLESCHFHNGKGEEPTFQSPRNAFPQAAQTLRLKLFTHPIKVGTGAHTTLSPQKTFGARAARAQSPRTTSVARIRTTTRRASEGKPKETEDRRATHPHRAFAKAIRPNDGGTRARLLSSTLSRPGNKCLARTLLYACLAFRALRLDDGLVMRDRIGRTF